MAGSIRNHIIAVKIIILCWVVLLLSACDEGPDSPNVRICKIITEKYATSPADMKFISIYTTNYATNYSVDIEFDDINPFGVKVRKRVTCMFDGARLHLLKIDNQYASYFEIPLLQMEAVATLSQRNQEQRHHLWNEVLEWIKHLLD